MDKEIPKKEIRKAALRRWGGIAVVTAIIVAGAVMLMRLYRPAVSAADLRLGTVDTGAIEISVNATGRVVPAFEEIINSPIDTRVLEVYHTAGDSVDAGTPLLRLDLQSAETRLRQLGNERSIRVADREKAEVTASTAVSDLEMQIRVCAMTLEKLREDLASEVRLDSIGSGTGERVRQARLAYETAALQLEQLKTQLDNERRMQAANLQTHSLNISIAQADITEMERTLTDARVMSPRQATLTFIVNEIGRQVAAGEKLAVIADLHHFKVEGEIPDSHAGKFGVGSKAMVQIGKTRFTGIVSNIVPQSQGGVVGFTITLDDNGNPALRSGQSTQTYIFTDIREDATRIPSGPYYNGPGKYTLFVKDGDVLRRREVTLGEANYEYVEVTAGLQPGEQVNLTDLKKFEKNETLIINN